MYIIQVYLLILTIICKFVTIVTSFIEMFHFKLFYSLFLFLVFQLCERPAYAYIFSHCFNYKLWFFLITPFSYYQLNSYVCICYCSFSPLFARKRAVAMRRNEADCSLFLSILYFLFFFFIQTVSIERIIN